LAYIILCVEIQDYDRPLIVVKEESVY